MIEPARPSQDRIDCEFAGYASPLFVGILFCRCTICARCGKHTGNSNQGHFWSFCNITATTRSPHFCCPNWCELEPTDADTE